MARRPALTPKHRAFVEAYVRLGVAWKAYAAVYPDATEATAQTNGPRLLRNAQILEAVNERRANLANALGITEERVLVGLLHEAEHADQASARVRSWELLGKRHGWADRTTVEGDASVVFRLELGSAAGTEPDYGDDPDGEG